MSEINEDALIEALDNMMNSGISRLKIDVNENLSEGEMKKEYHHGRCDVGSPFATGKLFDLEDTCG